MADRVRIKKRPKNQTARNWCKQVAKGKTPIFEATDSDGLAFLTHMANCPWCRGDFDGTVDPDTIDHDA